MIDTDKYERLTMNDMEHLELWELASKLFAEVKRLRKQLSKAKTWVRDYLTDINGNYQSYENRVLHNDFRQQMGMEEEE